MSDKKKRTKIEKRIIIVKLTDAEVITRARTQADIMQAAADLEDEMKKVAGDYKDQIKSKELEAFRLSRIVKSGEEQQEKELLIEYHTPAVGCKRISRVDTGEEVAVEKMTEAECQGVLEFVNEAADADDDEESPRVDAQAIAAAKEAILKVGNVSTSIVQRGAKVSYAVAQRIMEALADEGFVSEEDADGRRKVLAESGTAHAL